MSPKQKYLILQLTTQLHTSPVDLLSSPPVTVKRKEKKKIPQALNRQSIPFSVEEFSYLTLHRQFQSQLLQLAQSTEILISISIWFQSDKSLLSSIHNLEPELEMNWNTL